MRLGLTSLGTALGLLTGLFATMTAVSCDASKEGGENGGDCSGDVTDACCCLSEQTDEEYPPTTYVDNACGTTELCPALQLLCPGTSEALDCNHETAIIDDDYGPANRDALTCILDVMARGTIGKVQWELTAELDPGWARRTREVYLFGGEAIQADDYAVDLSYEHEGARHLALRPEADFAACRDATDDAARLECLFNPSTQMVQECVPAYRPED